MTNRRNRPAIVLPPNSDSGGREGSSSSMTELRKWPVRILQRAADAWRATDACSALESFGRGGSLIAIVECAGGLLSHSDRPLHLEACAFGCMLLEIVECHRREHDSILRIPTGSSQRPHGHMRVDCLRRASQRTASNAGLRDGNNKSHGRTRQRVVATARSEETSWRHTHQCTVEILRSRALRSACAAVCSLL